MWYGKITRNFLINIQACRHKGLLNGWRVCYDQLVAEEGTRCQFEDVEMTFTRYKNVLVVMFPKHRHYRIIVTITTSSSD